MRLLWFGFLTICFAVVAGCYVAVAEPAMPQVLAIIVCRTVNGGPADQNASSTGSQNRDWDLKDGKYHCRRIAMEVESAAEQQGQPAPAWTTDACQHSALTLGPQWDAEHPNSAYRFRWVACPTPIHASKDPSSPIVGWVVPQCPYEDGLVECEVDSEI